MNMEDWLGICESSKIWPNDYLNSDNTSTAPSFHFPLRNLPSLLQMLFKASKEPVKYNRPCWKLAKCKWTRFLDVPKN